MSDHTYLSGTSLAGMSPSRSRVKDDFYATPFYATEAILDKEQLHGSILEPAAGEGHISKVLFERYPNSQIVSTDLVQRNDKFGCGVVGGVDFLTESYPSKFDNVFRLVRMGAWFYGRTRHTLALNKAVNSSSQQRKLLT